MPEVNLVAVIAAAIASMALGALWYGPLFGKTWMKLSGVSMGNASKNEMPKLYAIQFVGSLVLAYVLSVFLGLTNTVDLMGAVTVAFWAWLGFQATLKLGMVLWEGKSWNLYFLHAAHDLINLSLIATVLTYL